MGNEIENIDLVVEFLSKKFNIADYDVVLEKNQNALGDGHIGIMRYFAIRCRKSGKVLNFVAKLAQPMRDLRRLGLIQTIYKLETHVYSEVFPAFKEFEKEKGVEILKCTAEMYWFTLQDMKEMLILDNLKVKGFTLYDRIKPADWDHAIMVVKELANLHGVALAYKLQKPERFHQLTQDFGFNVQNFVVKSNMTVSYRQNFADAVEVLRKRGKLELVGKFQYMVDNHTDLYKGVKSGGKYDTFCHSDAWMSNFMFKYEAASTTPSDIRIVDFQGASIRPPLSDVAMFLYLTCDKTVLRNFEDLLNEYYEVFFNTTRLLGTDLSEILPRENLKKSWKGDALFAILSAPIYIKMQLCNDEEIPELSKYVGGDCSRFLAGPIRHPDLENRLLDVMTHYGENFL